jgi:hypothetical protein
VDYRMLGSLSEAGDAVQESWLRLTRSDPSGVANLGGWLTTVVARVCLDMLRSRKSRREEPLGVHMPIVPALATLLVVCSPTLLLSQVGGRVRCNLRTPQGFREDLDQIALGIADERHRHARHKLGDRDCKLDALLAQSFGKAVNVRHRNSKVTWPAVF